MFRIILFLLSILFFNCKSTLRAEEVKPLEFPKRLTVKFEKIFSVQNNVLGIHIWEDSLLLVGNHSFHHHFSLYHSQTGVKSTDVLKAGRGANASMGFISNGVKGDKFWVYDLIKEKVIMGSLIDTSQIESYASRFYYSCQMLDSGKMLATGDYDSDFKIFKVNFKQNRVTDSLFRYPQHFKRVDKMDYESFLFCDSLGTNAVLASRFSDQIEFFNLKSGQAKTISGEENYQPVLSRIKQRNVEMSARNAKTRYGFVGGKGKPKRVYLLYSGNNHNSQHEFFGNQIWVYDWEGHPITHIQLDRYIVDFDISEDGQTIYALDAVKKEVLRASIRS